jgi:tetratricopeptide (TPR) repeat protein
MKTSNYILSLVCIFGITLGCGGVVNKNQRKNENAVHITKDGTRVISEKAKSSFAEAVEVYKKAEASGWQSNQCESVVKEFREIADDYNMEEASYNVGVVYRKCKMMDKAKEAFNATLSKYPKNQLSMTQLAVMELETGNEKRAEDMLRKAVGTGQSSLEAVPAYVNAATILRQRAKKSKDDDAFKKAEMNLRRALAIDSKYMPALYQLAMIYLDQAVTKNKSSFLTLSSLVCSQGIKLNPEYGPIYHVYGMVLLQQKKLVDALKAFETAFAKDNQLFASYMNFGAINLNFRGYQDAKVSFEKAIALNSKSYDGHIGLGVALRGLNDFAGAKAEYQKASEIDPNRTDYIFNVGVLEMDYTNNGTVDGYLKAKKVFQKFLGRLNPIHKEDPDGKGPLLSWEEKAKRRVQKCDENVKLIKEAEKEMAEMEKLQKEQAQKEAEMKAALEKAKELEKKEAEGVQAPPEGTTPPSNSNEAGANQASPKDTNTPGAISGASSGKSVDSVTDTTKTSDAKEKTNEKSDVKTIGSSPSEGKKTQDGTNSNENVKKETEDKKSADKKADKK